MPFIFHLLFALTGLKRTKEQHAPIIPSTSFFLNSAAVQKAENSKPKRAAHVNIA
jgi:hypothetical protein